ncbi:MAG TPA: GGDEF domain-containing protein [Ideonella sp.]|nr:GGDEF domain-containing protein [Ideonella sp.]
MPTASAARWLADARAARAASSLADGLRCAREALASAADDRERGEAGHLACFFLFRLGELAELVEVGQQAAGRLQAAALRKEWGELLRWMTLAACELGRFELAMRCATEGCALAQQGEDLAEQALTLNAMAACFERIGDPWQAERLMQDALALARQHGGVYARMATLNNLSAVTIGAYYLLRGGVDAAEADAALARSAAHAREAQSLQQELQDPFFDVFIEGNLGEALLHQGLLDEAERRLHRALADADRLGYTAQSRRIRCSIGEGLCDRQRPAEAYALLNALWNEGADGLPHATLIRLHAALHRACRATGRIEQALDHLERAELLQRQRAARQLRAQSELLVTRVEAEQNRLQAERARLEAQTERARATELALRASQDPLTSLGNRRYLDERLPALLAGAEEQAQPLAVAVVDIDHFKLINDHHGHLTGDRVLAALAQMLREGTRSGDLLARMGGEEFLIALPDTPLDRASEVCSRLRQRVAEHAWDLLAPRLRVTISIGLSHAPAYDVASLYERADRALYRAKQAGRNRVRQG